MNILGAEYNLKIIYRVLLQQFVQEIHQLFSSKKHLFSDSKMHKKIYCTLQHCCNFLVAKETALKLPPPIEVCQSCALNLKELILLSL